MKRNKLYILLTALVALLAASCSTTSRIPEGELLYTGMKVKIESPKGEHVAEGLPSELEEAVEVAPNNYWSLLKWRYPFPLGLWLWNHWDEPKSGLKKWFYNKYVEEPVLVSDVRPEVRTEMLDQILDNNGYFRGKASYSLDHPKNKKKARVVYDVETGPAYTLDSIIFEPDTTKLDTLIQRIAAHSTYLRNGERFSTDSLAAERAKIANYLRNLGYYFFKPEYIEYLADSTITPGKIALELTVAANTPEIARRRFYVGKVTTVVNRNEGGGEPDTIRYDRGEIIQMLPSRLRRGLIPECVTFRPGHIFSVRDMNRTQTFLSRMGIFNSIDIIAYPDTTSGRDDLLDVRINCTFDKPIEVSVEANVSSKSNSYLGPGITLGMTNRNLFGGGEQLNVSLTGSYEWQTGRDRASVFNSYEAGITSSLSFPRLLAPKFIPRSRRDINWTRITLNADLLNRPHYFKMAQFNLGLSYDWRVNRNATSSLTPFKLTYTKLIHTTEEFDSIMDANRAIAQSFRSQFIPQLIYTYTYDRRIDRQNSFNWTFTVQEAGNLFWSIYELCGKKGEKNLFGTPFSQFVKASTQLVYNWRIVGQHYLVSRAAVGAAHAYGNSTEVPYAEQFYVGGANSVRAFTVRSLGPGSYRPEASQVNGYFDQTGTFKFEANVEDRFPIMGPVNGAVFLDAGNVWLLKKDPQRPGGELRASTFLKDLALGTGAGIRLDISMLVVRLDLGVGIHAPYNTGKRGYYNMTSFKNSLALHLAIGYPF